MILMPLNPSRRKVESIIRGFLDVVKLHNPNEYYSSAVKANIDKMTHHTIPKQKQALYIAKYLSEFPFLKRIDPAQLATIM